jgi:hypothetical protein
MNSIDLKPGSHATHMLTVRRMIKSVALLAAATAGVWMMSAQVSHAAVEPVAQKVSRSVPAVSPVLGTFTIPAEIYGVDKIVVIGRPTSKNQISPFTYTSSNQAVAVIDGTKLIIKGVGTTTIRATQQGATGGKGVVYDTAFKEAVFTVTKRTPPLTGFPSVQKTYGDADFELATPGTNVNALGAFSYSSSNTAVATISGSTVRIVGAGKSTITVTQAETANYAKATTTAVLTVAKASPIVGTFAQMDVDFGIDDFEMTPPEVTINGAPIAGATFTYSFFESSVANAIGSKVRLTGAGFTSVKATLVATATYGSVEAYTTLNVKKVAPVITDVSAISKTYGDADFFLSPKSKSTGAFTFESSNSNIVSVANATLRILNAGSVVITVTQAGDNNFLDKSVDVALTVKPKKGTLNGFAIPNFTIPSSTYVSGREKMIILETPPAIGTVAMWAEAPTREAGATGAISYTSSDNSVVAVQGGTISYMGAGTATVTAKQAAAGNFAESSVSVTVKVTGTPNPLTNFVIGAGKRETFVVGKTLPLSVTSSTGSKGDFFYEVDPASASLAEINGSNLVIKGAGTVTVFAKQKGYRNIGEGTNADGTGYVSGKIIIDKATPSLGEFSVPSFTIPDATYGANSQYSNALLTAPTTDAGADGAFTYSTKNNLVVRISADGKSVEYLGAGDAQVTATQAETANYKSASVTGKFSITGLTPTITFGPSTTFVHPVIAGCSTTGPWTGTCLTPAVIAVAQSASKGLISFATSNANVATATGTGSASITYMAFMLAAKHRSK